MPMSMLLTIPLALVGLLVPIGALIILLMMYRKVSHIEAILIDQDRRYNQN